MSEQLERISLVDQIYYRILHKLQTRELKPGDRLNIEDLAKLFGVSRTPVRETISRLAQEGLVEQRHNSGPRITLLNEEEEADLIEANASLFDLIIDHFKQESDLTPLVKELRNALEAQKKACEADDAESFHKAAVRFHVIIIETCRNKTIREFSARTQNQINMCTFAYMTTENNRAESITAHESILEAFERGDIDAARERMRYHNTFAGTEYTVNR